jgi:transposase
MRRHFDNESKTTVVELLQSGNSVRELCEEYNLQDRMIRRWRREYDQKNGDLSNKREPTSSEIELSQLKKELRETKLERDILKKAVSIFSKSDS